MYRMRLHQQSRSLYPLKVPHLRLSFGPWLLHAADPRHWSSSCFFRLFSWVRKHHQPMAYWLLLLRYLQRTALCWLVYPRFPFDSCLSLLARAPRQSALDSSRSLPSESRGGHQGPEHPKRRVMGHDRLLDAGMHHQRVCPGSHWVRRSLLHSF